MGDPRGFLKVKRQKPQYRAVCERLKDYKDVVVYRNEAQLQQQASRCMDCGTPFCHWACPLGNLIPEWNDLVFNGKWQKAASFLKSTNNFPEITGRICPALCEYSCVLGLNDEPVSIRENELDIIEHAFSSDLVKPNPPSVRTGKKVAVVGSGPSGLAAAAELNRLGHQVTVFEKDDEFGGILRYGIPDFKLEKQVIERRIDLMKKEGIDFKKSVNVGVDYDAQKLRKEYDALCLCAGSRVPRDMAIEGRTLKGIHFAMDYLIQANRRVSGRKIASGELIDAKNKKVIVIGGGDTGADCVGVANRQLAACVAQIELMPQPPECRTETSAWPKYPLLLKTSTSHEEGAERQWEVLTKKFIGENGTVKKLSCVKADFSTKDKNSCPIIREAEGTEFEIEADLVILALGFLYPQKEGLIEKLNIELDVKGNVKADKDFMTSVKGVFSAGDMHRGQSLVVWAIAEGMRAATCIDKYLSDS